MSHADYYKTLLGKWQPKAWGSKPSTECFELAHVAGCNPGKQALHIAMCLRADGCSVQAFTAAGTVLANDGKVCGPANNKRGELVTSGFFTQSIKPGSRPYAFVLAPTAKLKALVAEKRKGVAAVASAGKAPKPVKAKPRKPAAKPVKVQAPAAVQVPAPPVTVDVPVAVNA